MWRSASPIITNRRLTALLLLAAVFIVHNAYRIHLLRTHQIHLPSYIASYPLPLTPGLHVALHARYQHLPFAEHLYLVPAWTLLAVHQLTDRRYTTPTLHAYLGRLLVVVSLLLAHSSIGILAAPRVHVGWLSFRNGCVAFIAWWAVCLAGLRGRDHSFWGVHLVAVGFGTALLRVGVFVWLWLCGGVVDEERYERVLGVGMCVSVVVNPMLVTWAWGVRFPSKRKAAVVA